MRRLGVLATGALLIGILVPASVVARPAFTAVVTDNGACSLTATGTWQGGRVTFVHATWFLDGLTGANVAFSQDTDPTGLNPGVLGKNSVTFTTGQLPADVTSHNWYVQLTYLARSGANLNQTWSVAHTVNCGL